MINDFRLDLLKNRVKIGEGRAESCSIKFNYDSAVMKGIQLDLRRFDLSNNDIEFNMFRDRIRPVLIRDGVETSLGVYMIMAAPKTIGETSDFLSVEGYDETMIVKQAAFEDRTFYASGSSYITIIQQILTTLGLTDIYVEDSDAVLPNDLEVATGDNCLDFINNLLDAINYQHLYADADGVIQIRQIKDPTAPEFIYRNREAFNIKPPIKLEQDIYSLPNVLIGIYSSPDFDEPIVYKKVNDDPQSLISTVSRGYKVVQKYELYNVASDNELEDYIDRLSFEAMQATERVTFSSIAEGGHEPNTAIQLDTDLVRGLFIEKEWDITIAQNSFTMNHTAERKVFV